MLVDRSSFPQIDGAQWSTTPFRDALLPYATSPSQCATFDGPQTFSSFAQALLKTLPGPDDRGLTVDLQIFSTYERPDFARVAAECATWETPKASTSSTMKPVSLPGMPQWATTIRTSVSDGSTTTSALGFYRGVEIRLTYGERGDPKPEIVDRMGKLFSDEVAKLDAPEGSP